MASQAFLARGGKTFCNMALCAIGDAVGADMRPLKRQGEAMMAADMRQALTNPHSGFKQVSPTEATLLANQGFFAFVAGPGVRGEPDHVASVRPDSGEPVIGLSGPILANISKQSDIRRTSMAFQSSVMGEVRFYTNAK
mgnify:CR=1 FL=1